VTQYSIVVYDAHVPSQRSMVPVLVYERRQYPVSRIHMPVPSSCMCRNQTPWSRSPV